jgi:hypothetical protein
LQEYPVSSNEEFLTSTKGMLTLKQVLSLSFLIPCEISSSHGFRKRQEQRDGKDKGERERINPKKRMIINS